MEKISVLQLLASRRPRPSILRPRLKPALPSFPHLSISQSAPTRPIMTMYNQRALLPLLRSSRAAPMAVTDGRTDRRTD